MMPVSPDSDRSTEGILKRRKTRSEIEKELRNLEKAREAVETKIAGDEPQGRRIKPRKDSPNRSSPVSSVKVTKSGKILTGVVHAPAVEEEEDSLPSSAPRQIIVRSNKKKLTIIIRNPEDRQREMVENPELQDAWGGDEDNNNYADEVLPKVSYSRDRRQSRDRRDHSHGRNREQTRSRERRERTTQDSREDRRGQSKERTRNNRDRSEERGRGNSHERNRKTRDRTPSESRERDQHSGSKKKPSAGVVVSTRVLAGKEAPKRSSAKRDREGKTDSVKKKSSNQTEDKTKQAEKSSKSTKTDGSKEKAPLKKQSSLKKAGKETRSSSPDSSYSRSPPPPPKGKKGGEDVKVKGKLTRTTKDDNDGKEQAIKLSKAGTKVTTQTEAQKKKAPIKSTFSSESSDDAEEIKVAPRVKIGAKKTIKSQDSEQEDTVRIDKKKQKNAEEKTDGNEGSKRVALSGINNASDRTLQSTTQVLESVGTTNKQDTKTADMDGVGEEPHAKAKSGREEGSESDVVKRSKSTKVKDREDDEQEAKSKVSTLKEVKKKEPLRQKEAKPRLKGSQEEDEQEPSRKKEGTAAKRKEREDDSEDGRKRERTEEDLLKEERSFKEARVAHERSLVGFIRTTTVPCVYYCPGEACEKSRARQTQSDKEAARRIRELEAAKEKPRTKRDAND